MSILEILEAHTVKRPWSEASRMRCKCGETVTAETEGQLYALHRAHVAQVLEQHEQEAKAEAVAEVANAFQYKAWSELIEGSLQDRLRIAQPITDWLRARANQMRVGSE